MPIVIAILGIAGLALGAVVLIPKLLAESAKTNKLNECAQKQAQLVSVRQQGGDAQTAARLQLEIEQCAREANSLGIEVDMSEVALQSCKTYATQMDLEWTHYKATVYSDPVKRTNTRSTMLRSGEDMVNCLRGAVTSATSQTTLTKIERFVREQCLQSKLRMMCFLDGVSGCSHDGVNEPHVNNKATDELLRIGAPLGVIELYGVEWTGDAGRNHLEGTTREALYAIDAGSVLRQIRLRSAELGPQISNAQSSIGRWQGIRL